MAELRDKITVITGASSGIGEVTALEFAQHGAKLVITGRDEARLSDVAKRCLDQGATEVEKVISDLSTEEGIEAVHEATMSRFGTIHILINNAGGGSSEEATERGLCGSQGRTKALNYSFSLMVRSVWQLSGLFVNELIKNKGTIINNTSIFGTMPSVNGPYAIMKGAGNHMTRLMAKELGPQGVRVNAVLPGYVKTRLLTDAGLSEEESHAFLGEQAELFHVLDQKVLTSKDVAQAILFLASGAASAITGVLLPVDCGALLSTPEVDLEKIAQDMNKE